MTISEAIQHCEEVAKEQDKLCKRYDDASGYSRYHDEAIRTTDAKRCGECAKEHRQLAEWLKDYKRLLEQEPCEDAISRQAVLDGIAIIAKAKAKSDAQKSLMGRVLFFTEHLPPVTLQPKTETLDKIRAEIIENSIEDYKYHGCGTDELIIETSEVLRILDKYRAESEVQDADSD